jgi:putative nucleotidyltransferase with HDIG domain
VTAASGSQIAGVEVGVSDNRVEKSDAETLEALLVVLEAKATYLKKDAERARLLCERMARRLNMSLAEVEEIRNAGLLHDIGMIHTPDSILGKPGPLTPDEFTTIKDHVTVGAAILSPLHHLGRALDYIRYHHERVDGSGYPEGLSNGEIPFGAQLVGAADAFCALTGDRPYQSSVTPTEALQVLHASQGRWFSPRVLEALEWAVVVGAADDLISQ